MLGGRQGEVQKGNGGQAGEVISILTGGTKEGETECLAGNRGGVHIIDNSLTRVEGSGEEEAKDKEICGSGGEHGSLVKGDGLVEREENDAVMGTSGKDTMGTGGDPLTFSIGSNVSVARKFKKKSGRKLTSPATKIFKGEGRMYVAKAPKENLMTLYDTMKTSSMHGGKWKSTMSGEEGMDGNDVDIREVYDAGKRLKTSNGDDGDCNPFTVRRGW